MRRPGTMIAMGLLPMAVVGGLLLGGAEGSDPEAGAPPFEGAGLGATPARDLSIAGEGPAGRDRPGSFAPDRLPVGGAPCGPTTDARRCRSGD